MAGQVCEMLGLASRLAAAVADVLEAPSCEHRERVHEAVRTSGFTHHVLRC